MSMVRNENANVVGTKSEGDLPVSMSEKRYTHACTNPVRLMVSLSGVASPRTIADALP